MTPREQGEQTGQACLRASKMDGTAAGNYIVEMLKRNGETPGEILTDLANMAGFKPRDNRAFGGVFAKLVREGRIRCVGYCERNKGHGTSGGRVWRAT